MLDFDSIDDWAHQLSAALKDHLPDAVDSILVEAAPEFVEDAQGLLFKLADRDAIIDATLTWIRGTHVVGYHGTRLTDPEVESVRELGLLPLKGSARRNRLARALSAHPRWSEVVDRLEAEIEAQGPGKIAGCRDNLVALTLSRAGLEKSFNHYLTHGAEFDYDVAFALLGDEGVNLLSQVGQPRVVSVAVPGKVALEAAHFSTGIEFVRGRGDVPNLVREFLKAWSFRLAHPEYQARSLMVDCGMAFDTVVPRDWLLGIDSLRE